MIAEIDIQCTAVDKILDMDIAMKSIKYFIYSVLLSSFTFLAGCGTTTDPAEMYKDESAEQIFNGGEAALRGKDYKEAVKHFEALDAQYPFGRNAEIAELHIIYAYYMSGDYLSAEAASDRFIHSHPTNPHVDYAYYMRGLSNYFQNMGIFERIFSIDFATRDLTQVKKSFTDFSELVTRYPDSYYAPAAHQYMVYLRNVLADHQLQVAQYYYDHQAYVASANRASLVVEYYQGAPAVPYALVMMAKSYDHLQMTGLHDQVVAVIRYNYPDSVYLQEVTGEKIKNPTLAPVVQTDVMPGWSQTPHPLALNQKIYPINGARSSQPVLVNQPFRSLASMVGRPAQAVPTSNAAQQAALPPPTAMRAQNTALPPTAITARAKPTQAVTQPQQAATTVASNANNTTNNNGNRSGNGIGLGDLFNQLSKSPLLALHKNTAPQSAAPQGQQPPPATKSNEALAEANTNTESNQAPGATTTYPFPSNGTR